MSWLEVGKSIRYTNTSTNTQLDLKIGDTITFEGRPENDLLVIITGFTGTNPNGPIGMVYLPWRTSKQQWATRIVSLCGDPRHIMCYPNGQYHRGEHIDWTTVQHMPEVDHPTYIKKVQEVMSIDEYKE